MNKLPLTPEDIALVEAARAAVKKPIRQIDNVKAPALVLSAVRLDDGQVIMAQNMTADVGTLGMCAEPQAIAEANRQPERAIDAIVAVYYDAAQEPKVISPCGRCREIITDFLAGGFVILRDPGTEELYKVRSVELLPLKYCDYWQDGRLV